MIQALCTLQARLDVPALGIYGPTNPKLQGPFGEEHVTVETSET